MNLPNFYRFWRLRVFVLRIGKSNQNPVFNVVYAVAEPFSVTKALDVSISQFNKINHSLSYTLQSRSERISRQCFIAVVTIVENTAIISDIITRLLNGYSLADACSKWSIKIPLESDLNFYFAHKISEVPYGIDKNFPGDITYSHSWRLENPSSLLTYDSVLPLDLDKGIASIGEYIAKYMGVNPNIICRRVGNIEVLFRPACDAEGRSLVEHSNKDNQTHLITIRKELYNNQDEVIVNVRITSEDRIITDDICHSTPSKNDKMVFSFSSPMPAERTDVKIWLRKGSECRLVHKTTLCIVKQININMQIESNRIMISSEWHRKIRETIPYTKRGMVDDAAIITRTSTESFSIGNGGKTHEEEQRLQKCAKPDDAFFPKGWNPNEGKDGVHGALEFLKWFRKKTEDASDIMLQDPYFEDVALYFIASSESQARYTVITQTGLKTNPDGIAYIDESSDSRADKILAMIRLNPTLFAGMQLVVKNFTGGSNKLHDRYLIITYNDGRSEGYALSNSLQGATTKQPMLVTRIGDGALRKVMDYMSSNIQERNMAGELMTLYDFEAARIQAIAGSREIADSAFMNWIQTTFSLRELLRSPERCIQLILNDILHGPFSHAGAIPSKISTLGNMLANTPPHLEHLLITAAVGIVRNSSVWSSILEDFILHSHDAEFPVGFRNCPNQGWLNLDLACLANMDFRGTLSMERMQLVERSCCERDFFSTWGQHYACRILAEGNPTAAADALKALQDKVNGYQGDRLIYPSYLATNMLLHEIFNLAVFSKGNALMHVLLNHDDKWIRSIGSLILLYCATNKDFNLEEYKALFTQTDEIMAVAHQALYVKPDIADKKIFYKWILTKAREDKNAREYLMEEGLAFVKGVNSITEKKEYASDVLYPLINEGILDLEEMEISVTDALYNPIQESESMTVLLPFVLEKIGASMTYLKNRLEATKKENNIAEGRLLLKDEDSCFEIETKRRNIAPLCALFEKSKNINT